MYPIVNLEKSKTFVATVTSFFLGRDKFFILITEIKNFSGGLRHVLHIISCASEKEVKLQYGKLHDEGDTREHTSVNFIVRKYAFLQLNIVSV
jgi:hypothetical protein